jgi:cholinesterase
MINADFTCPAGDAARWRSQNSVKAWRYRYFGVWPNTAISADAGAWHGEEVAQIFGNAASISGQPDTWQEIIFATLLRSTWAAFAKYPDTALSLLGLPLYDASSKFHWFSPLQIFANDRLRKYSYRARLQ